jgi:AcrR family transcriptional regulator
MATHDERLETLLDTAARVFAEKGYHPTSMRDLARATGLSLAGIYHYVHSKEELLYLIQDRTFGAVLAGAESALEGVDGPTERLDAFIHHHLGFFASHMAEMKVLSHEAESLAGDAYQRVVALKRRYVAMLTDLVRAADPNGHDDPTLAAYALFGMMNWIYTWYRPGGRVSIDELADRFSDLFLHGLARATPATLHGAAL